ncbi:MAG: hypothetical protein ABI871_05365 [Chthoniobacterales bacterium]
MADLKVISRTSTHQYKNSPQNLPEIGKQLAVATVLEGTVQRVADQVRVNVQLIKAASEDHLWSHSYNNRITDVFALESEIAQKIAQSLQAKLSAPELERLAIKPTTIPEAYDAYLRGLAAESSNLYSAGNLADAIAFYEDAVRWDPNFGLAWGRLSRAEARMYFSGDDKSVARRSAAQHALEKALTLEANAPETLLAHAYFRYWVERDFEAAKAAFTRVRELMPGNSDVPAALARITRRQGHWDQSMSYWEQTVALDPRNREWLTDMAWTFSMLRQFPLALKTYERALEIAPTDADLLASVAEVHQAEGNLAEAGKSLAGINASTISSEAFIIKVIELFLERNHGEAIRLLQARLLGDPGMEIFERGFDEQLLAHAQQFSGDTSAARGTAEQAQRTLEAERTNDPDNPNVAAALSRLYALLGNAELALSEAMRAAALRPSEKDAVMGPAYEENLAMVEAAIGNADSAIGRVKRLLELPYNSIRYGNAPLTKHLLKLDPAWDPLRSDPRFQQLIAGDQP